MDLAQKVTQGAKKRIPIWSMFSASDDKENHFLIASNQVQPIRYL